MPIDPRTPVVVGVGQVVNRPVLEGPAGWTEPLELMVAALESAARDASGNGARSALLERVDEVSAIPSFVWSVPDPARTVCDRLGIAPARTRLGFAGGTLPMTLLFDAAQRIAQGQLDVAAVVGADAVRSRALARRAGVTKEWFTDTATEPAEVFGVVPPASLPKERDAGLAIPVNAYALLEHALRRERGWTRAEHLDVLGRLGARMAGVAEGVELAWTHTAPSPAEIVTPSRQNRMVAAPYTKLCASNVQVDMGAAFLVCSLGAARSAGVPEENLVFPLAGAKAREQWHVAERHEMSRSVAMAAICERVLGGPGGADGIGHLDLYSCFPVAVQLAGDALGIDLLGDDRAPTVTGGLTFFGGPGNNYVTHSIATMSEVLRAAPGTTGLVTALGWYSSTHAWGTFSTSPPAAGFRADDVQDEVDKVPLRDFDPSYEGAGVVESYTVVHDRDGGPSRAIAAVRSDAGTRALATLEDPSEAAQLEAADPLGARATIAAGVLRLS